MGGLGYANAAILLQPLHTLQPILHVAQPLVCVVQGFYGLVQLLVCRVDPFGELRVDLLDTMRELRSNMSDAFREFCSYVVNWFREFCSYMVNKDIAGVRFLCGGRDMELLGDFLVRISQGKELQYLSFSGVE